jgi:hypothetical protein
MEALLARLAIKIGEYLLPRVAALIPLVAATVVKEVVDKIPDIDIPGLSNVFDLTETIRDGVNNGLPDGIDIPFVSDAFENITGFDLSDSLFGKK